MYGVPHNRALLPYTFLSAAESCKKTPQASEAGSGTAKTPRTLLVVVSLFDQPLVLFKDRIKINALPEHPVGLTVNTDLYFLCICIFNQRIRIYFLTLNGVTTFRLGFFSIL